MKLFRLCVFVGLLGTAVACKDTGGKLTQLEPLAGLRYVNLVPDTSGVDFRVIDVVSYAPNQVNATFRTGGAPYGLATTFLPPHQPVLAGTRHIRVFMYGTTPDVASQVLLDTTYTFLQGSNYTFYLYGYARPGSPPQVNALITKDSLPSFAANQWQVRVIHLAPTMAPSFGGTAVDVWVDTLAAAATPVGAPNFANRDVLQASTYLGRTARPAAGTTPALSYRVAVAATGTTTPIISAAVPAGVVGTATSNPVAGALVAGTGISAVIVPRSVAGSLATSFTTPSLIFLIDQQPPRTAP
jgi:hypothetical protein